MRSFSGNRAEPQARGILRLDHGHTWSAEGLTQAAYAAPGKPGTGTSDLGDSRFRTYGAVIVGNPALEVLPFAIGRIARHREQR
jgi:hypothetical protein